MDEVIDRKNAGQITEEIQDTGNIIKTENSPAHHLVASPPSPQFQCYYCEQRFLSQSDLIAHMDKESADAREKQHLDGSLSFFDIISKYSLVELSVVPPHIGDIIA